MTNLHIDYPQSIVVFYLIVECASLRNATVSVILT